MKKAKSTVIGHSEGYEIIARREDYATDFYRFFYGELESEGEDTDEKNELRMTGADHFAFLKCACLLFAAAVATVVLLLVI